MKYMSTAVSFSIHFFVFLREFVECKNAKVFIAKSISSTSLYMVRNPEKSISYIDSEL